MKRLLSLALCLVMVLGLFTGVVGAEEPNLPLIIYRQTGENEYDYEDVIDIGISSSFGFNAYTETSSGRTRITGATFALVDNTGIETNKLGELRPDPENNMDCILDTDNAYPRAEGYLTATVGDTVYSMPISISDVVAGVYSGSNGNEYIPPANRAFVVDSEEGKTVYIKTMANRNMTVGTVTISGNQTVVLGTRTKNDDGSVTIPVTAPAGFSGKETVQIHLPITDSNGTETWDASTDIELTFTDGANLTICYDDGNPVNRSEFPACFGNGLLLKYGLDGDVVTTDNDVVFKFKDSNSNVTTEFGTLSPNGEQYWDWSRNSAVPGSTGTMEVTIGETTYSCPVTIIEPDLAFYQDADLEEYVSYNKLSFLYDTESEAPICYMTKQDWINGFFCSNDQFTIESVDDHDGVYAIYAKEGTTGTHNVQFIESTNNPYPFNASVTFTDGRNLTLLDCGIWSVNTENFSASSRCGCMLYYGPDQEPVPSTATVQVIPDEGWTTDDLAVLQYEPGNNDAYSWDWIFDASGAALGASGTYAVIIGGNTYSFHATFTEPPVSFYRDEACSIKDYIPYSDLYFYYSGSTPDPVYVKISSDYTLTGNITSNNQSFVVSATEDSCIFELTLKAGVIGKQEGLLSVPLKHSEGWDNNQNIYIIYHGSGGPSYNPGFEQISKQRDVVESDLVSEGVNPDNPNPGEGGNGRALDCAVPLPVQIGGTTYYMGISFVDATYPYLDLSMHHVYSDPEEFFLCESWVVTFWNYLGTNDQTGTREFSPVTDETTLKAIHDAFTSLTLTMAPFERNGITAKKFPALYKDSNRKAWEVSITPWLTVENAGYWRFEASGTIGGTTVTTYINQFWDPQQSTTWSPDLNSTDSVVKQINDYIDQLEPVEGVTNIIQLPAGEFEGDIVSDKSICIHGATNQKNVPLTTWKGSIEIQDGMLELMYMRMVGNGKNNQNTNVGVYGDGNAAMFMCEFEDYGQAVVSTRDIKTTSRCTYRNNRIAIYIDDTELGNVGGNPNFNENTFIGNDTAIYMNSIGDDTPVTGWNMTKNKFIDNDVDFRNKLHRHFYLPGCFFAGYDKDGNLEPRAIQAKESSGTVSAYSLRAAAVEETDETIDISGDTPVHVYPAYSDPGCTKLNYDYSYEPVVSTVYTSQYQIPAGNLDGKNITVMDGNTELAQLDFTSSTFSMRRMMFRAMPEQRFDATVKVERMNDKIEITLCDLPAGKTPMVKIPCGNVLKASKAVHTGGDEALVEILDGYLCFVATMGGTWTITADSYSTTEPADDGASITVTVTGEPADDSTVTVDVPEDWKGETVIVTAPDGTETEVEVAEDGTVTFDVDQEGEYTLEKKESGLSGLIGAIVGALGGIGNDMDFTDVAKNAWYHDDVAWAYSEGLMDGTGNGKFSPDMATSRAMIVTILWRLEGSPMGVEQSAFSDVVRSSWYGYAVDWAGAFGIVEGYDGKFAPNDAITREQLAAILYRYAKHKGYDVVNTRTDLGSFTDADKVSDWALAPMQWAVGNGLINGTNDALNCGGTATRAQTAAILHRFFG